MAGAMKVYVLVYHNNENDYIQIDTFRTMDEAVEYAIDYIRGMYDGDILKLAEKDANEMLREERRMWVDADHSWMVCEKEV